MTSKKEHARRWMVVKCKDFTDLAAKFDFEIFHSKSEAYQKPDFFDNDKQAIAKFDFRIKATEPDGILSINDRLDLFVKALAKNLVDGLGHNGVVTIVDGPSVIAAVLRCTRFAPVYAALLKQITKQTIGANTSSLIARVVFSLSVPQNILDGLKEAIELTEVHEVHEDHTLLKQTLQMIDNWLARTIDFELMLSIFAGLAKRGIHDSWEQSCYIDICPQDEDSDDSIIELDKRVELFLKAIVVPDLIAALDTGLHVKCTTPGNWPLTSYAAPDSLFSLLSAAMRDVIKHNRTKPTHISNRNLTIYLEQPKHENS